MQPVNDDPEGKLAAFEANADRNVFVIMRYGTDPIYRSVERTIKEVVHSYGFDANLAKDLQFYDELWRNLEFCMKNSRYGIVVFEGQMQPVFNPNVAVELGYMLGFGKRSLVLKEQSLPTLPTDVVGHLYETFRAASVKLTVSRAIERWLEKLGHRKIQPTEVVSNSDPTEAKKKRTEKVIHALTEMKSAKSGSILRQAGSLSSLAISENEEILFAEDPALKKLLLQERDAMESLLNHGIVVRCLVSPFLQIVSLQLGVLNHDQARTGVLPRLRQLKSLISKHLDNPNLQIAVTARLPHDNILIDEVGGRLFLGKRRLTQWGFPYTTIYHDPTVVKTEAERFDSAFFDAAAACLRKPDVLLEDHGSIPLKKKVIEILADCEKQLAGMGARPRKRRAGQRKSASS